MRKLIPVTVLSLSAVLVAGPAYSQEVPVTALTQADRVCERGFTKIVGIKELRDRRVVLVDEIERLILVLDSALANGQPVGREGAGPGEYRVPSRMFSLTGDSSAVLDTPNRRLLVLSSDAEPAGVVNFAAGIGTLRGSDARGRFYSAWQGAVRRWTPSAETLDTVASYPVVRNPRSREVAGVRVTSAEDIDPFRARTLWAVAPDGSVAVVHPDPYRVEVFGNDGSRTEGPVIPVEAVRVTEGHKEQWRKETSRPSTVTTVTRGAAAPTYRTMVTPTVEPSHWSEYLPPFLRDAATFAPDGRLWVQRSAPADAPPIFDVFDSKGVRVGQITLPPGRELIGFGKNALYAAVRDDFDLMYLERYDLAGAGIPS
jgi:hypothetical protein